MSKRSNKKEGMVVPLRVPAEMGKRIKAIAQKNHLSEADIMRLAIERGFVAVEKMFEPQEVATAA